MAEDETGAVVWVIQWRRLARHRKPTAHARARYRCFLPDLAGLAGMRRVGPMPDPSS